MVLAAKKYQDVPGDHEVVRYVPWTKLRRADGTDEVIGVLPLAFQRRTQDKGLSVTWADYFDIDASSNRIAAVHVIRNSNIEVKPKSGFAFGNVAQITDTCLSRKHKVKIQYFPEDDNVAHAEIRSIPDEDFELFELLAAETWADLVLNKDVPAET